MIRIILETLNRKTIRVTGRIDGRAVVCYDGKPDEARKLIDRTMGIVAGAHRTSNGDAASKVMAGVV